MTETTHSGSLAIDAPARSQSTDTIQVRVTGAAPNATVEFTATSDAEDGIEWRSRATLTADGEGTIDLESTEPEDGTWRHADAMAWLWSMRPDDEDVQFPALGGPTFDVTLRAETDDATAETTISRVRWTDDIEARDVDRDGVVGTLHEPAGDGPHPVVVDLHGSAGRMSQNGARRLAHHGYATLALDYIGDHDAIPDQIDRIPLEYVDRAVAWLRDQPHLDAARVGLVGVSRGAELALLVAARRDYAGCVVSYSGSVPWDTPLDEPAWTDDGDIVPHITADEAPRSTDLDEKPVRDVVPAVETADGPILLLSGGSDPVWNSRRLSDAVAERLRDRDFGRDFEHRTYDSVGHYLGTPWVPLGGLGEYDRMRATAHAGADLWPVVLDYLEQGLRND